VVDAGETTVGSSVGSHSRTQRPSEVLGRRCRARVGVADVGWEQRSHLFGHKPVTSRSHSLLAQPCHRRNWFLHRTGQSTPTPMPLASFPTCGPPTTPSGAGPPPLLPPLCTSGVNISRSPETPTGRLTAVCVLPDLAETSKTKLRVPLRVAGVFGFVGGFLLAYQRSSCAFVPSQNSSRSGPLNLFLSSQILGMDGE
jgi:hypothetical protein